jgi:hypothetical protein
LIHSFDAVALMRCFLVFPSLLAVLLGSNLSPSLAAPTNPVVVGAARFTVITPNCIRLEYAPKENFVDAPSLFAANRAARYNGFRELQVGGATTIDTGAIRLTYTPDGLSFSGSNLRAEIKNGNQTIVWAPGASNPGNLGGTIRTLDGADGPEDLGQGLLSRDGWYLLDDSRSDLLTADWVQMRPQEAGSDWYLFGYGDNYRAALKSLTAVGGAVPMPRKYALGAWYSRYWPFSSADYRQLVQEYGQHDFPLDNMVLDMDWHKDGWTGWSWNRKLLPDAEELLPWLHQQGLHVTLNLHPADGVGPQEDQYAVFMRDMGADPATKQTLPFDAADKKYMDTLFADVFTPLEKNGVDFWWLDWQQYPYTRSVPDLTNLFWLNTLLYDRTAQNGQRGLSFSRWAGWGDHRHPIHFSGDASTSFAMLAFEVPFTSTAGNVGCFFWSHDIGGHNRGRNEESYTRWVQFGATSPVLRSHSTRDAQMDRRPWSYPKWAEDSMRVSFHLRSELFPYIYTSAAQAARETVPLDRPLYFDNPREEKAYHNAQEYLLGDNILAAPIVAAGVGPGKVGTQTVWFPAGTWYNYFTGERYSGGNDVLVAADINEFPLYVRGGVPVPMQPYQPRMATAPLTTLRVRCYPGADGLTGRSTLYEDDGVTTAYERGLSTTTPLFYTRRGGTVTVTLGATRGHYAGQPAQRSLIIELPDTAKATRATLNGKVLPVAYDAAAFTNRIILPARPIGLAATVVVSAWPAVSHDDIVSATRLVRRLLARHPVSSSNLLDFSASITPSDAGSFARRAEARRLSGVIGHSVASLKAALADQSLTSSQQEALLAVAGVGLVPKNEGAYLYHGRVRDLFYAPPGVINGNQITVNGSVKAALPLSGEPLEVQGPPLRWRGRTLFGPSQVSFQIAGRPYHLPVTPPVADALMTEDNVAGTAKVTASGVEGGYSVEGAVDGIVGGYPGDKSQEWSAGSTVGATLTLTWDTPQTVNYIQLYDRPNTTDQIISGTVTFSDGSTLPVGELPNDALKPFDLHFPAKTITSLTFRVTGVKAGTENAGLAEIAVFRVK